ncbi:MAG: hypothetical protein U0228_26840 [Myxococcaceae bacterium]
MTRRSAFAAVVLLLVVVFANRARAEDPRGPGPGRGPPPEALAACQSSSAGAACSFSLGGRTLDGTCRNGPNGEALACAPPHGQGQHHGPPPEALAACASSSAGAACQVTTPDGQQLSGTCVAGPQGQALACLPPRR